MTRYVALLRGVNVGGAKRVPMAELRSILESLGYSGVRTLLNSGNAIFEGTRLSAAGHADRIRIAIAARLNVEVPVIVKSAKNMVEIETGNTLAPIATDPSRLLVAFTSDGNALAELVALSTLVCPPEQLQLGEHAAYLWCPDGILKSKAGEALLGKFGRAATTRNWATVLKINALLGEDAA